MRDEFEVGRDFPSPWRLSTKSLQSIESAKASVLRGEGKQTIPHWQAENRRKSIEFLLQGKHSSQIPASKNIPAVLLRSKK